MDLCPSWLLKAGGEGTYSPSGHVNLSLGIGVFLEGLKEAMVALFLKKPPLYQTDPSNYHPVSNVSFLGKVTERVAAEQF